MSSVAEQPGGPAPKREGWLRRLSRNGTAGLSLEEARKVRSLNQFVLLTMGSLLVYTLGYLTSPSEFSLGIGVNAACLVAHAATFYYLKRGWHALAVIQFLLLLNAHISFATYYVGTKLGYHYYLFPFSTVVFLIVPRRLRFMYPMALVSLVLFIYFAYFADPNAYCVEITSFFGSVIRFLTIVSVGFTLIIVAFIF